MSGGGRGEKVNNTFILYTQIPFNGYRKSRNEGSASSHWHDSRRLAIRESCLAKFWLVCHKLLESEIVIADSGFAIRRFDGYIKIIPVYLYFIVYNLSIVNRLIILSDQSTFQSQLIIKKDYNSLSKY